MVSNIRVTTAHSKAFQSANSLKDKIQTKAETRFSLSDGNVIYVHFIVQPVKIMSDHLGKYKGFDDITVHTSTSEH